MNLWKELSSIIWGLFNSGLFFLRRLSCLTTAHAPATMTRPETWSSTVPTAKREQSFKTEPTMRELKFPKNPWNRFPVCWWPSWSCWWCWLGSSKRWVYWMMTAGIHFHKIWIFLYIKFDKKCPSYIWIVFFLSLICDKAFFSPKSLMVKDLRKF